MKEYVLHVKTGLKSLDGLWGVGFTHDTTTSGKDITFCVLRHSISDEPYAGVSVRNPLDEPDPSRGERIAFKRAVISMLEDMWHCDVCFPVDVELECGSNYLADVLPTIVGRFRGALWIAMGRPKLNKGEKDE